MCGVRDVCACARVCSSLDLCLDLLCTPVVLGLRLLVHAVPELDKTPAPRKYNEAKCNLVFVDAVVLPTALGVRVVSVNFIPSRLRQTQGTYTVSAVQTHDAM